MPVSIYERNIEAMKARYANVLEYLKLSDDARATIPEEKDLVVGVQDVCGKKVMCALKGGQTIQLDSMYDSEALLNFWFDSFEGQWDLEAKLLMYGLGNGMYAKKYLRSARSDCSMVIFEPSEKMLKAALENFDLTEVLTDTRIRIVFWPLYSRTEELRQFYQGIIEYKDMLTHKIAFYANYPGLFPNDAQQYITAVKDARDLAVANQIVHDRFGGDYNRNTFNNLKFMPDSLSYEDLIKAMPEDVPAIVVAAGPSLDNNINDLKEAEGKCLIISTDTALKPLALAGIKPDLAVIVDGKKDARYMSEESSKHVVLLCTPRSGDTFMNLHLGAKIFTDNFCNHIKSFMDEEGCYFAPLSTGGSVANSCFGLAEALGCKRIILVGQDLAYTGDKTHSKVTVRGAKETAVEDLEHVLMGVDINGDPIRTSREFKLYKEWFEDEISKHKDLRVIDATEGGIKIEGTILMTLKDAIARECTEIFDFDKIISSVGMLLPGEKRKKFIEYINQVPGQIRQIHNMIGVSLADYKNMRRLVQEDRYNTSQFGKLYKETRDLSDKIENSPVIEYVHNQLQERASELLDVVNKLENNEKAELLAVCDLGENYLMDMDNAIKELKPYMEIIKCDFVP